MTTGPILSLHRLPLLTFPRVFALRHVSCLCLTHILCPWLRERDGLLSIGALSIRPQGDITPVACNIEMYSASGPH